MSYTVVIKRASDGVERRCLQPFDYEKDGHDDWSWWAYGNMSCDCNRELEFARAANEDEPDVTCSDGRFLVTRFELPDGRIIDGPDHEQG